MKDRYRIINRTEYYSHQSGEYWQDYNVIWMGEHLPTELDQEVAMIETIATKVDIPFDVVPDLYIECQAVLQELYVKKVRKVGFKATYLAWRDYKPKPEDTEDKLLSVTPGGYLAVNVSQ